MNINKMLEYQTKDNEKIKLERMLNGSEHRKMYQNMITKAKDAQNKSAILEQEAGNLMQVYNSLKSSFEENSKTAEKLAKQDIDKMNEAELTKLQSLLTSICTNLSILEKKLIQQAEKINSTLAAFDSARRSHTEAKTKHAQHKALYDDEENKIRPEIIKIEKDLEVIAKDLDLEFLNKYKQKRQDKIFPILVPNKNGFCGGCFTELPSSKQSKLKEKGILECENCRRIIYNG